MRIESFMAMDKDEYRNGLIIQIDGKTVFQAIDGEPEDSILRRDFNDCYGIVSLMERAYKAGYQEEALTVINHKIDWDELREV